LGDVDKINVREDYTKKAGVWAGPGAG